MDEFVDLENGDGEGPSVEGNEASIVSEAGRYLTINMECFELPSDPSRYGTFWSKITTYWQRHRSANEGSRLPPRHRMSDGRPMLIQRSKNPKKDDAHNLCRCEDMRVCVELAASFGKQVLVKLQGKVERINHSFADHKSHPIVDDHPIGYPQLVAFIKSDNNFLIARKYVFLRARVLL